MSQPSGMRVSARAVIVRDENLLTIHYTKNGIAYFLLLGGGVETGETLHEALRWELREEAEAEIIVGSLRWTVEYVPARDAERRGSRATAGPYLPRDTCAGERAATAACSD